MKKLMIVFFFLLALPSINLYGQYGPWNQPPPPNWQGPWGSRARPMSRPSSSNPIWSRDPRVIILKRGWDYATQRTKMVWDEHKRRVESNSQQQRTKREQLENAWLREHDAERKASDAERYFPNTPIARSYRQAATAASMARARAEIIYRNSRDEGMRLWGVTSTSDMNGQVFTTPIPNRSYGRGTPQSRKGDLPSSRQSPASRKADLPFSRDPNNRRESSDNNGRGISGYGYGRSTTPKNQDRLSPSNDRGANNRSSDSNRNSGGSDTKSWRDRQQEVFDRRP